MPSSAFTKGKCDRLRALTPQGVEC
jgi:hypothetical protein